MLTHTVNHYAWMPFIYFKLLFLIVTYIQHLLTECADYSLSSCIRVLSQEIFCLLLSMGKCVNAFVYIMQTRKRDWAEKCSISFNMNSHSYFWPWLLLMNAQHVHLSMGLREYWQADTLTFTSMACCLKLLLKCNLFCIRQWPTSLSD